MKPITFILAITGAAVVGGSVVYFHQQKTVPTAAPIAQATRADATLPPPIKVAAPMATPPPPTPAVAPAVTPVADTMAPAADTAKADAAAALRKTVDALLDPHTTAAQKHNLFQQLAKSGQLPSAIAELKQRAQDNPTDAEIPTTLGEAQLNQVALLHAAGADINDVGILAMQADQSFNAALKIDPDNYEAQLVKAISMTYWPSDPTRDPQVVQTLSGIIDRQQTMPSNPDFAQAYLYLGNQYQKMGQPDKATATWQLGLQNYPNSAALQQKLSGQ
jgi:tetratricopeptide (TPR) repeat protein